MCVCVCIGLFATPLISTTLEILIRGQYPDSLKGECGLPVDSHPVIVADPHIHPFTSLNTF